MSENYEKIKKFQDEFFSTWSKEEQADMAHKFMGENLDNLVEQAERVQELKTYVETGTYIQRKLRKENKRYRELLDKILELQLSVNYSESDLYKEVLKIMDAYLDMEGDECED